MVQNPFFVPKQHPLIKFELSYSLKIKPSQGYCDVFNVVSSLLGVSKIHQGLEDATLIIHLILVDGMQCSVAFSYFCLKFVRYPYYPYVNLI